MLVEVRCPDVAALGPAEVAAAVSEEVLRGAPSCSAVLKSRESEMQQRSTRSVRPNLERSEKAVSQEKIRCAAQRTRATKALRARVAGRLLCFGSAPVGEPTPFTPMDLRGGHRLRFHPRRSRGCNPEPPSTKAPEAAAAPAAAGTAHPEAACLVLQVAEVEGASCLEEASCMEESCLEEAGLTPDLGRTSTGQLRRGQGPRSLAPPGTAVRGGFAR